MIGKVINNYMEFSRGDCALEYEYKNKSGEYLIR